MKNRSCLKIFTTILSMLACFGLLPQMQAGLPPEIPGNPDGCYPAFTTAEGCNALFLLGSGIGNTAIGWYSLFLAGDASFNTGVGAGALALSSTGANNNTAVGTAAMLLNTTGTRNAAIGTDTLVYNDSGSFNDAVGAFALFNNIDGSGNNAFGDSALGLNIHAIDNTAIGDSALVNNDNTGLGLANFNTAVGASALLFNTDGDSNTAVGFGALFANDTGLANTAVGTQALSSNITGFSNTAVGFNALISNTNNRNTAIGEDALDSNTTGSYNVALGYFAGDSVSTADHVICIGANAFGEDVSNTTWIGNVYGVTTQSGTTAPVIVSDTGQLGTVASSERFKKDIATMEKASETILLLRPVTFHYRSDAKGTPQFGLIAEEVAKVNPALVLPDKEGKPYSGRYDQVNAMLLNEFLKEHRKVEKLEAALAQQEERFAEQEKEIKALSSSLQKVSNQLAAASPSLSGLEPSKFATGRIRRGGPAPRVVVNNL
jgi:hypothetical protein